MTHYIEIDEEQRQLILLALAKLSIERPGWHHALGEVADRIAGGRCMYEQFRAIESRFIEGLGSEQEEQEVEKLLQDIGGEG